MKYSLLKEVENVARIFSTYFENNKLKNQTRELGTHITIMI